MTMRSTCNGGRWKPGRWSLHLRLYYWLFHNNYAHHRWEWEWHGFKSGFFLHLKPEQSDAKPLIPKRTLGATTDVWTKESTDSQEKDFKHRLEQETLAAADRRIDGLICSSRMTLTICRTRYPQD